MTVAPQPPGVDLKRLLGVLAVAAACFAVLDTVVAVVTGDARLFVAAAAMAGEAALALAGRRAKTERGGAQLAGYGLLAITICCGLAIPEAHRLLAVTALVAVALVIPFLEGLALRRFLVAALVAVAVAVGAGATGEDRQRLAREEHWLLELALVAAVGLAFFLLWRFSSALRRALAEAQDAAAAMIRAREERDRADARYQTLGDAVPPMLFTAGPDGVVDHFNRRWTEFTGLDAGALRSGSWMASLHASDVARVRAAYSAGLSSGATFEMELRVRRHDGLYRTCLMRLSPAAHDGAVRWFGSCTDIHDLKEAQRAVRESEERLRALIVATANAVWTASPDGQMRPGSVGWSALTGQPEQEFVGDGWQRAVHPEDRARVVAQWRSAMLAQQPFETEFRMEHPRGEPLIVHGRAVPVRNGDGTLREWIGTLVDVTEARVAGQRLRDESRRKDEFLAMLAHELRNPLAPIVSALELMKLKGEEVAPEVQVIQRQVRHLVRLVDELVDVARLTRGRITLRRARVDLASVARAAVEAVEPVIAEQRHALAVEAAPVAVDGDALRLTQAVSNLLNNAARFTPAGGNIAVRTRRDGAEAVLEVEDDGPGVPVAERERIFDLFVQGPRGLDRSEGGLGIGLTLVKQLVVQHGGKVSLEAGREGRGSRFVVRLPALATAEATKKDVAPAQPVPALPRRVLVVDDNRDAADVLADVLELSGFSVDIAPDGPTALERVKQSSPDVILLDIGLPRMDGYEVARRLRGELRSQARLIAVTGYGQPSDREKSEAAGFDGHMVKPVDLDRLIDLLGGPPLPGAH